METKETEELKTEIFLSELWNYIAFDSFKSDNILYNGVCQKNIDEIHCQMQKNDKKMRLYTHCNDTIRLREDLIQRCYSFIYLESVCIEKNLQTLLLKALEDKGYLVLYFNTKEIQSISPFLIRGAFFLKPKNGQKGWLIRKKQNIIVEE